MTASRLTGPGAGADTTVLRAQDAPVGSTLGQLLAQVSDIEVQRPGGATGVASIFLRGAKPNFTMVMVEGMPLNDPTNSRGGSADVSAIQTLGLERVEIVRGSMSALYGSGAVGGVVNLILPGGTPDPEGQITLAAGSDGAFAGNLLVAGPLGQGAGGSLDYGYADAGDGVPDSSRINQAVDAKVSPLDGSDRYGLVARVSQSEAHAFPDASGGPRLAVRRATEATLAKQGLLGGHWRFDLSDLVGLELGAAGGVQSFRDVSPGVAPSPFSPGGVPAGVSQSQYSFARSQLIARFDPHATWTALAGIEAQQEDGRTDGALTIFGHALPSRFDLHRWTTSAFGEAEVSQGPVSLDASLRVDRIEGFGSHLSPRINGTWRLGDGFKAHAGWGRSFKAPSFYALGNSFVGNPALRPELSQSAEIGLGWQGPRGFNADATVFHARYSDLVSFVPGPPPRLENLSSVVSKGVQVTLAAPLGLSGGLHVSTTYVDTANQADGSRLLDLPAWRSTAGLDWKLNSRLTGYVDATHVGQRLDYSIVTGTVVLPAYAAADVRLVWLATPRSTLEASLQNAFDKHYEAAVGFPAPGLSLRLALNHRL